MINQFITGNVRILGHFLPRFWQDCQDIWYPFGSGHHIILQRVSVI